MLLAGVVVPLTRDADADGDGTRRSGALTTLAGGTTETTAVAASLRASR